MFKVMIIDDEPIIRKGLRNIIDWKQYDCEICAEAADGVEGAELIRSLRPDIVFTDIKMPEVDGLSMIREIKDKVADSKIIILTGYRDFDYAQEAIKLGAFDFILKPSKIEELIDVVKRAIKELKFQRDRTEEIEKLKELYKQNLPVLRERLLFDVLSGIKTNEELIKAKMSLFGIEVSNFTLLVVENDSDAGESSERDDPYSSHLYQFGIINTFEETISEDFKIINVTLDDKRIAFILKHPDVRGNYIDMIQKKCTYLQDMIANCFGFTVTIGISSEGYGAMQLSAKLKECMEALEHKFYIGNNSIICYKDLHSFYRSEDNTLLENYQKLLTEGIKSGNEILVNKKLKDITDYIECCAGAMNRDNLKNFYCATVTLINNIRVSVGVENNPKGLLSKDISSLIRMIEKSDNLKELNAILGEIALSVVSKVNIYNNRGIKLIMQRAMEFIDENYNEQISLNEIAEHTFVSTYYISRLFKKELGKNFVDYLNEIRITKAKELLKDLRFKTYEVAELVGISDAHYFSKLFKKYENITPSEYRDTVK
ncbi:MAG: response regulator [Clostridiaceae bacterium]|nr:response regulator [Clostridiaceae bacterium]